MAGHVSYILDWVGLGWVGLGSVGLGWVCWFVGLLVCWFVGLLCVGVVELGQGRAGIK